MYPALLRRLVLVSITACCAACGGGGNTHVAFCFGTNAFCSAALSTDPIADAGADQRVTSGDTVTLDGSASRAQGTGIRSFSWAQTAGPTQALSGATTSRPTFIATDMTRATDLVFLLTVVDDRGVADTDAVTVTVDPSSDAAMRAAGELVAEDLRPPALEGSSPCVASATTAVEPDAALAGLWLSARIRTVGDDAVLVAIFLDEARRLVPMLESEVADRPDSIASEFVAAGLQELATFADTRDPALASDARRVADAVRPATSDIVGMVRRGERTLVRGTDDRLVLASSNVAMSTAMTTVTATRTACVRNPPVATDPLRLVSLVAETLATPEERSAGEAAAATP